MALIDKLTAIADGFRTSRGLTDKLPLDKMAELAAERVGTAETIAHADIPNYVKAAALEVARKVSSLRTDDSIVFLAMADSHHAGEQDNTSWQEYTNIGNLHASQAAKVLAYALNMDFVCHLGDVTFGDKTTTSDQLHQQIAEMSGWLDEAFKGIPQLWTVGNHDTGLYAYENGTETALETPEYLFSVIGSRCEGAVYGSERFGYCYRDFEAKKLRVICLNTSEGENLAGYSAAYVCSPEQLLWFAQTLREVGSREDAADWSVMVLGHYPLDYLGTHPASAVVKAYVEGGSITQNGTAVDFAGANYAKFVADFHGHTHCYKTAKLNTIDTSASTATEFDAWRVAVPNSGFYRNNHQSGPDKYGLYFEDETTYDKTIGGAQDTAFVVNVVIPSQQVIHSICYGAGYDRVIGYGATVYHSITRNLTNVTISDETTAVEAGAAFSANLSPAEGYDLEAVTVTMGGVDITSTAWDGSVITIPEVTGSVVITASAAKQVSYINLVRSSIDTDGSTYNGIGYKDGYRLGSSGSEAELSGCAVSGYIELPADGQAHTLRLGGEGITWSSYGCQVVVYDAEFTAQSVSMNYNQIGNAGYGTWDTTEGTAFTLTWTAGHAFSTAKYLRISAKGSGVNMIVTIDEPID